MSAKTLQNTRHSKRRANRRLRSDSSVREPADRVRMEDTCLIDDVRPLANNLRSHWDLRENLLREASRRSPPRWLPSRTDSYSGGSLIRSSAPSWRTEKSGL